MIMQRSLLLSEHRDAASSVYRIRANLVRKCLSNRSAAYHNLNIGTERCLVQSSYRIFQSRHRRCQKSGAAYDLGIRICFNSFNKFLLRNIYTKVDDFESRRLQHHSNQVLSDIMQVSCNGSDYHFAGSSCPHRLPDGVSVPLHLFSWLLLQPASPERRSRRF